MADTEKSATSARPAKAVILNDTSGVKRSIKRLRAWSVSSEERMIWMTSSMWW